MGSFGNFLYLRGVGPGANANESDGGFVDGPGCKDESGSA